MYVSRYNIGFSMLQTMNSSYYWNEIGYSPLAAQSRSDETNNSRKETKGAAETTSTVLAQSIPAPSRASEDGSQTEAVTSKNPILRGCDQQLVASSIAQIAALSKSQGCNTVTQPENFLLPKCLYNNGNQVFPGTLSPYSLSQQTQAYLYNQAILRELRFLGIGTYDLNRQAALSAVGQYEQVETKRLTLPGAAFPLLGQQMTSHVKAGEADRIQKDRARDAAVEKFLATLPSRRKKRFKYSSSLTEESRALKTRDRCADKKRSAENRECGSDPDAKEKKGSSGGEDQKMNKKMKKPASRQSKYRGVCWNKSNSSWKACLKVKGKNVHIGYFDDEVDAARAYDVKAYSIRGQGAKLNFPRPDGHFA